MESESDVDSDLDSIEQDDDFALKWLDPEMVRFVLLLLRQPLQIFLVLLVVPNCLQLPS